MIEIKGKYNTAIVYQSEIDETTYSQIQLLVNQPFVEGETIRIMPDCHAGTGCVIGYTQTLRNDKVCPNLVGVDIACGMLTVKLEGLKENAIDLDSFNDFIKTNIPVGRDIYDESQTIFPEILNLKCYKELKDSGRFERALGTLGGGNHFMELDKDSEGNLYFIVHTGSRNLGKQVAEYYQDLADAICNRNLDKYNLERDNLIKTYKETGRKSEIQKALLELNKKYKESKHVVPKDLAYLEGSHCVDYLYDMRICQWYAEENRRRICKKVVDYFGFNWYGLYKFSTLHNYIDIGQRMLRKGAIDCSLDRKVLIPINMRDGSIIARGKGNEEYNCSGPHGAGRLLSRSDAKELISMDEFKKSMEGIYTSCVSENTLDESPMAYKSIDSVLPWIKETAEVIDIIKPIWNYKAGGS